jgi:hypothetical protein
MAGCIEHGAFAFGCRNCNAMSVATMLRLRDTERAEDLAALAQARADLARLRTAAAVACHEHACGGPELDAAMRVLGEMVVGVTAAPRDYGRLRETTEKGPTT